MVIPEILDKRLKIYLKHKELRLTKTAVKFVIGYLIFQKCLWPNHRTANDKAIEFLIEWWCKKENYFKVEIDVVEAVCDALGNGVLSYYSLKHEIRNKEIIIPPESYKSFIGEQLYSILIESKSIKAGVLLKYCSYCLGNKYYSRVDNVEDLEFILQQAMQEADLLEEKLKKRH